jgi:hypothetical protein
MARAARIAVAVAGLSVVLWGCDLARAEPETDRRAASPDAAADPAEQADPFWPYDAGIPEAGTRHREVLSYPFACTCRAAGRGDPLGAVTVLVVVLTAVLRRATSQRTPSATRNRR